MLESFHFDPLNAVLILIAIVGGYKAYLNGQSRLQQNSDWHGEWIKKHQEECNQRERNYMKIFTELQVGNAKLTEISTLTSQRVERIEHQMDREA